jgi:hypothetical protein
MHRSHREQARDQNRLLNFRLKDPLGAWTWLRDSADEGLNFVFSKIVDSNVGDVSDAGMVYYILTGDEDTDPNKLRTFLNAGQGRHRQLASLACRGLRLRQTRRSRASNSRTRPQRKGCAPGETV